METTNTLTFRDILDASTANLTSGANLTVIDVLVGLTASLLCAAIISWTYRTSYQGVLYQKSFNLSLILISLVTTSVIMVISGNLVLSLGMVGALSIVRFRAAIKDPLDIVYMFWAVAIGIANGVANIKVSLTATIVISILIILLNRLPFGTIAYLVILKYNADEEPIFLEALNQNTSQYIIKSKNIKNGQVELIAEARIKKENELSKNLTELEGFIDLSLLAYNSNILDN
tara:strand:+ start:281 stop:973 length:693 start_codon:yes stop_codon:yes gene_type:complete